MNDKKTKIYREDGSYLKISARSGGENANARVMLFLPGYTYTAEGPIFFFTQLHFLQLGYTVVAAEYRYSEVDGLSITDRNSLLSYIKSDMQHLKAFLDRDYKKNPLIILGKSLGTVAQALLIDMLEEREVKNVWLTPALPDEETLSKIKDTIDQSCLIIGDHDQFFDVQRYGSVLEHRNCHILKNVGHEFESDDIEEMLEKHLEFIRILEKELKKEST